MFENSVNMISMLFRLDLTNPEMPHQLIKLLVKTLKLCVIGSFCPKCIYWQEWTFPKFDSIKVSSSILMHVSAPQLFWR